MEKKDQPTNNLKPPKWLRRIQHNSWEPEILLSGFVLIGLLQLPEYVDRTHAFLRGEFLGSNLSGAFSMLKIVIYSLVTGLILHLFLRGVWIGYVGLSYTFPIGINPEKLNYQPKFLRKVEKIPPITYQIDRLEKVCSSIFSTCFFLIMCLLGIICAVLQFVAFSYLMDWITNGRYNAIILQLFGDFGYDRIVTAVGVFIAIDFFTIGLPRKSKVLSKIYYPVHRLIGFMTLSYLYRPIYYTYASNLNRWYVSFFLILFFSITLPLQGLLNARPDENRFSLITFYVNTFPGNFFGGYYEDRNEGWKSSRAFIPSPVVKDRFLEIFIKHDVSFESQLMRDCQLNETMLEQMELSERSDKMLDCIGQFYHVKINQEEISQPEWMFHYHIKERRKGFITFLDVSHLPPGRHTLEITTNWENNPNFAHLYFFKE